MLESDVQQEINRLNGALEILGLLRERLELQLGEVADETGQEALDETLSYIVALRSEYQRRQQELHPHHKTYLFYLTDEGVLPILHDCYIPLVEGKAVACEFFNKTFRLADWYVRVEKGMPKQVVNETYSWLVFDQHGKLDLHAAHAIEYSPLPTEDEREQINNQLFDPDL
ncbi:MAG: hypothetical protein LJE83_01845 [Gammaproteobacteria bacterium]|nr:hypothetical protein [Gammaproteobacteria bacterium]